MQSQCWLVDNQSSPKAVVVSPEPVPARPYRLYRFLSDLEDLMDSQIPDAALLQAAFPLIQRLLASSPWLGLTAPPPDPETGWSVQILYDEPDFPLTLQLVSWDPGSTSPIHNHGCWGLVTLLAGCEKNHLWERGRIPAHTERMVPTGSLQLNPGDTLMLFPDAIHSVEVIGDEPTVSFNVYGPTDYAQRFEFDLDTGIAQPF